MASPTDLCTQCGAPCNGDVCRDCYGTACTAMEGGNQCGMPAGQQGRGGLCVNHANSTYPLGYVPTKGSSGEPMARLVWRTNGVWRDGPGNRYEDTNVCESQAEAIGRGSR